MSPREVVFVKAMQSQGWAVEHVLIAGEGGHFLTYKPAVPVVEREYTKAFDVTDLFEKWLEIPEVMAGFLGVDVQGGA